MPSEKDRAQWFRDIVDNIDRIERYVNDITLDDYRADQKTRDAVERCLQRITEAARRLGDEMDVRQPDIPWHAVRALGNVLRHDYESIHDDKIWEMLTTDIQPLRLACVAELERLA